MPRAPMPQCNKTAQCPEPRIVTIKLRNAQSFGTHVLFSDCYENMKTPRTRLKLGSFLSNQKQMANIQITNTAAVSM